MKTLTEQQVLEQYGAIKVKFTNYYKYSFTFDGKCDEGRIEVCVGGNSEDIYRLDIDADVEYTVQQLGFSSFKLFDTDGTEIAYCYNYY